MKEHRMETVKKIVRMPNKSLKRDAAKNRCDL
jgi:hypothetical protein